MSAAFAASCRRLSVTSSTRAVSVRGATALPYAELRRLKGDSASVVGDVERRNNGQKACFGSSFESNFGKRFSSTLRLSKPRYGKVTFKLADIGEGIAEAELLKWHIKVGDTIEEMSEVCEVQSDKAAVEISSRYSGTVLKLHADIGSMVKIGGALLDIEVEGQEDSSSGATETHPPKESATPGSSTTTPHTSEKPSSGPAASSLTSAPIGGAGADGYYSEEVKAAPVCRAFANEKGVDLRRVKPSGSRGQITKEDVIEYLKASESAASSQLLPSQPSTTSPPAEKQPSNPSQGKEEIVIRGFAKAMVKSMTESLKVPHMAIEEHYDITDMVKARLALKNVLTKRDPKAKLTITPFIIKAVSLALRKVPILNSKFNAAAGDKYTQFYDHNISMAIDTPNGLVVPNIKNVDKMTLLEVQHELARLQELAVSNKLSSADLTGGTLSISNVGVIGGVAVTPILFDGQATILGLGRVQTLPRYHQGVAVPRDIMSITASVDHRHVDGATVARYMKELRHVMECPELMMLECV